MKNKFCQLWLTCSSAKEARAIAQSLLEKRLVACAKQLPVSASYRWQGKIEQSSEILLVMESDEKFFQKIESEIAKLHSYDTFVLEAVPVSKLSEAAEGWLRDEIYDGTNR